MLTLYSQIRGIMENNEKTIYDILKENINNRSVYDILKDLKDAENAFIEAEAQSGLRNSKLRSRYNILKQEIDIKISTYNWKFIIDEIISIVNNFDATINEIAPVGPYYHALMHSLQNTIYSSQTIEDMKAKVTDIQRISDNTNMVRFSNIDTVSSLLKELQQQIYRKEEEIRLQSCDFMDILKESKITENELRIFKTQDLLYQFNHSDYFHNLKTSMDLLKNAMRREVLTYSWEDLIERIIYVHKNILSIVTKKNFVDSYYHILLYSLKDRINSSQTIENMKAKVADIQRIIDNTSEYDKEGFLSEGINKISELQQIISRKEARTRVISFSASLDIERSDNNNSRNR